MLDRTSAPVQSRDIATRFVETLTGKSNEVMRLRFIHDSDRCNRAAEREGMIAQLWPDIIAFQKQGYGVFYFVNEVEHGRGSGKGGCATDADVKDDCRVLGTDHDKGLPNIWHVQPPIVVYTSKVMLDGKEVQKGQALWPVYELPKAEFKPAQLRLAKYYGADKSISNPSRVLRLPGTLHLKNPANPQLVTFEKFTDDGADFFEYVTTGPELLAALPPELEGKSGRSSATGAAITFKHLRQLLSYLDPNAPRDEWIKIIAGIRATPIENDEDESERRHLALEFSRGDLDRNGRFKKALPSLYTGDDAVNKVFDSMPPRAGGVGYGTIYHLALRA